MALSEADTHAKLVNPALYKKGWTEDHIKREETTGAIDIMAGKARRRSKGRIDLTLRVIVTAEMQPVALAVIEVKKDSLPPATASIKPRDTPRPKPSTSPSSSPRMATCSLNSTA